MQLCVFRRSSAWADQAELEKTAAVSARVGNEDMPDKVRWTRSYVIDEAGLRLGTMSGPSARRWVTACSCALRFGHGATSDRRPPYLRPRHRG